MKTAEISSQDTFIDQGGDVGMSTEPIDFTEDVGGDEPEEISGDVSAKPRRAARRRRRGAQAGGGSGRGPHERPDGRSSSCSARWSA